MARAHPWCSLFERLTPHTEEGLGLADGHTPHGGVETLDPLTARGASDRR